MKRVTWMGLMSIAVLIACGEPPAEREPPCGGGGFGGQPGAPPDGAGGLGGVGGAELPPPVMGCISAPAHVADIPDSPCWGDTSCTTWFGCLRGICLAYYGDVANPGYCTIDLADEGTFCGAVSGADWQCDGQQRCCGLK
jgi:hypothetical protein